MLRIVALLESPSVIKRLSRILDKVVIQDLNTVRNIHDLVKWIIASETLDTDTGSHHNFLPVFWNLFKFTCWIFQLTVNFVSEELVVSHFIYKYYSSSIVMVVLLIPVQHERFHVFLTMWMFLEVRHFCKLPFLRWHCTVFVDLFVVSVSQPVLSSLSHWRAESIDQASRHHHCLSLKANQSEIYLQ